MGFIRVVKCDELRNFLSARRAPRGPEVQQDDITFECIQRDIVAIDIFDREVQVRDFRVAAADFFRRFRFRRLIRDQHEGQRSSNDHDNRRSYDFFCFHQSQAKPPEWFYSENVRSRAGMRETTKRLEIIDAAAAKTMAASIEREAIAPASAEPMGVPM